MATHIFRGASKEEAYQNLTSMAGEDVFIIREFTDQSGQYCIEAASKVSNNSMKANAIPKNAQPTNGSSQPSKSTAANPPTAKPNISKKIRVNDGVERLTVSQLLSNLRMAGFAEPTLRQFIYWLKQQNERDPNINKNQPKDSALYKFAEYLEKQKVLDPILELPRNPVLLVGPPGSGKTVTTAKLAARAIMQGENVNFVSLDCVRTGAIEQAKSLSNFLETELVKVENVVQFNLWIDRFNRSLNQPIAFIDSLSTNIYDMQDMRWLLDYMEAAEQNELAIEPILVVSATTDATTIGDYATTFKSMGVDRAILTCWDIASKPAATFSAIMDAGIKIAMISDSPYLTGGLDKLTAQNMAKKLTDKKGMPAWLEQIGRLND